MATDAVIFARASFSDRLTKRTVMPGFSASNRGLSSIASSIWGLDTIAIVTIRVPSGRPNVPAPAQPVRARPITASSAVRTAGRDLVLGRTGTLLVEGSDGCSTV